MSATTDVIIIGAGMAGVTAARALRAGGASVTVLECNDRIGGRIHSVRDFCGEAVEAGAEFIHGVGAETWPDVRAAGLEVRPCPNSRDTLFNLGDGTRWLPFVLMNPGVWPAFTILRRLARFRPPDISAREFIELNGYRGRARILAELVLTAHLPGSIDEVGVLGLKEDGVLKLESGLNHRVAAGYDRVVEYIATDLDIRRGFTVARIDWRPDAVNLRSTDGRELSARAAVSTLPVGVLKSGAVQIVPALPAGKLAALRGIEMGPVLKVLLRFEERFWPGKMATLVCGVGPVTLYWAVFYGAPGKPPVLTAYCTGPRAAALGRVSEDEATAIIMTDLRRLFPKGPSKLIASRRIDWAADPSTAGGYTFLRPGGTGARARLAAADTGALFWAGAASATTSIADAVQGAFVTGLRAAGEVLSFLSGVPSRSAQGPAPKTC